MSLDTKCYTISESSRQPDSGNLGPTAHRVNLGCQLAAFATQIWTFWSDIPRLIPEYVGKMVFALNKSILGGFGVDFLKFRPFFDTFDFQPP